MITNVVRGRWLTFNQYVKWRVEKDDMQDSEAAAQFEVIWIQCLPTEKRVVDGARWLLVCSGPDDL